MNTRTLAVGIAVLLALPVLALAGPGDLPVTPPVNGLIVAAEPSLVVVPDVDEYTITISTFDGSLAPIAIGDWTATLSGDEGTVIKTGTAAAVTFDLLFTAEEVGSVIAAAVWSSLNITQDSTGKSGFANAAVAGAMLAKDVVDLAGAEARELVDDLDGVPTPLLFLPNANPTADTASPKKTIYNDHNENGVADPGEVIFESAPLAPATQTNDDGTTTIYNDENGNGTFDDGEQKIADVPAASPAIRDNGGNSFTVYNDANGNGTLDDGEQEFATTPAANPQTQSNPDGSTTVYNDANDNGTADEGENLTTLSSPTEGSETVGPLTVTWDFSGASPTTWSASYRIDPPFGALVVASPPGLFCAPFDLNELHPLPRGDLDGDGLSDQNELGAGSNPINTNSNSVDLDGDGVDDSADAYDCDVERSHDLEYTYEITNPTAGPLQGVIAVSWTRTNATLVPSANISDVKVSLWRDIDADAVQDGNEPTCDSKRFVLVNNVEPAGATLNTFLCNDNGGYRLELQATDDDGPVNETGTFFVAGLTVTNEPAVSGIVVADDDGQVDLAGSWSDAIKVSWNAVDPAGEAVAMTFRVCLHRMDAATTAVLVGCQDGLAEANATGDRESTVISGLRGNGLVLDAGSPFPVYRIQVTAFNPNIVPGNAGAVTAPTFALFHNDAPVLETPLLGATRQQTQDGRYLLPALPDNATAFCVLVTDPDSTPEVRVNVTQGGNEVANVTMSAVSECFDSAPERPSPVQANPRATPPYLDQAFQVVISGLAGGSYEYYFSANDSLLRAGAEARDRLPDAGDDPVIVQHEFAVDNVQLDVGDANNVTLYNDANRNQALDPGEALLGTPPYAMYVTAHADEDDDGLPDHVHVWQGTAYQQRALPDAFPVEVANGVPCAIRPVGDADHDGIPDGTEVDTCDLVLTDAKHIPDSVVLAPNETATVGPAVDPSGDSQICCVPNFADPDPLAGPGVDDPDDDDATNGQEASAGTDPNNPYEHPSDTDADLLPNIVEKTYVDANLFRINRTGHVRLLDDEDRFVRVYQSGLPQQPRGPLLFAVELPEDGPTVAQLKLATQTITVRGDHLTVATTGTGASVSVLLKDQAGTTVLSITLDRAKIGTALPFLTVQAGATTITVESQPFAVKNNGVPVGGAGPKLSLVKSGDDYALAIDTDGNGAAEQTVGLTDSDGDLVLDGLEDENGNAFPDQLDLCGLQDGNDPQDGACPTSSDYKPPWEA